MKMKSDYVLHAIGEEYVVVAVEERTKEFCGMIRLNTTGAFLWKCLEKEATQEELVEALMQEYNIEKALAREAVESFLQQLSGADVIEP